MANVENTFVADTYCLWCKHRQMSEYQFRLLEHFHKGKTINEIASDLGVSSKTIFAHKYLVMHKFNLRTDSDLKGFSTCWRKSKHNDEFQEENSALKIAGSGINTTRQCC